MMNTGTPALRSRAALSSLALGASNDGTFGERRETDRNAVAGELVGDGPALERSGEDERKPNSRFRRKADSMSLRRFAATRSGWRPSSTGKQRLELTGRRGERLDASRTEILPTLRVFARIAE
jgi:hypothetical protein